MRTYARWILAHRYLTLFTLLAATAWFAWLLTGFGVDVGSSSIVLEDDPDLKYYDESRYVFGSDEYVMIAFHVEDAFAKESIALIDDLSKRLKSLRGISDVLSLTTVRLFRSPMARGGLFGLAAQQTPVTLNSPECDCERARKELMGHAAYRNNLVAPDGKTVSVIAYLYQNPQNARLELEVHRLDEMLAADPPDTEETRAQRTRRAEAYAEYRTLEKERKAERRRIVSDVRAVLAEFAPRAQDLHASGLPFILVNMIEYIETDVVLFGVAVLVLFFVTLYLIFRRLRWVVLPLLACAMTVIWVMGVMVLFGKETTIVTSNISSLLMVIAMAHSIYLIMQFGELRKDPQRSHEDCVVEAIVKMGRPCFFVAAAGVAGFSSLLISHIKPVMEFGEFMSVGVLLAFVLSFLVFPAGMGFFRVASAPELVMDPKVGLTLTMARLTERHRGLILAASAVCLVVFGWGASLVKVEARFIDYFKTDSDIYKGLSFIDQEMGGTTSLEVVLTGPKAGWFWAPENFSRIATIQEWLEKRPEVGKVLSAYSLSAEVAKILKAYTRKEPADAETLQFLRKTVDPKTRDPYITEDGKSVRVFVRVRETWEGMKRSEMIRELRAFLAGLGAPKEEEAHITGIFVLYTNMLESLVGSQLRSLTLVFATLLGMLWLLFRSFKLAVIGMIPNTLPVVMVFGAMGWLNIHLDMATVMVASVSLGFAVDPAIQYVIRYRDEVRVDGDYIGAMYRSNASIGRGIFYTSITIIVGFWVLALSRFKPTINFGLITGIAMMAALIGALTGLPLCMIAFRPVRGVGK